MTSIDTYPAISSSQAEFAPRLARAAAIAGEALCSGLVDCSVDVDIEGKLIMQPHNRVIIHAFGEDQPQSFVLNTSDWGLTARCRTAEEGHTSDRQYLADRQILTTQPENPSLLRVLTVQEVEGASKEIASQDATIDTILDMAHEVSNRAARLGQQPELAPSPTHSGGELLVISAATFVPALGRLLQTVGSFAAQEQKQRAARARMTVDCGSSGRLYGMSKNQHITLGTADGSKRTYFNLSFRPGFETGGEEFIFADCFLRQVDFTNGILITKDTLEQHRGQFKRVRYEKVAGETTSPRELGKYPADSSILSSMVQAAIEGTDPFSSS